MKRKIVITTGTRADYGFLRPLMNEINSNKKLELFLIVTGMHLSSKYGKTINEIKNDGFKIFKTFNMIPKDGSNFSMSTSVGNGIIQFSKIFKTLKPDINIILGDRDEMLASAIASYHMNIPNAHIHGGDKSLGGIDEYNRHAITKMSNFHFAASQESKKRILKLGEDPRFVFLTGSPSIDEIKSKKISNKNILYKKYGIKFTGNEILFVQHSVTTEVSSSKKQISQILAGLKCFDNNIIAILPNSDPGGNDIIKVLNRYGNKNKNFHIFRSLPREDYLGMIKNSAVLVGNSSSGMIEASYFSTPVVNLGIRQKGREHGANVINLEKINSDVISKTIKKFLYQKNRRMYKIKMLYGNGNASKKIVKYLETVPLNEEVLKKTINL